MQTPQIVTRDIPIDQIEEDKKQPRKDLGIDGEDNRLLVSLNEIGLREPLAVVEIGKNRYKLIDGHRRFNCACKLGWKVVRCEIHPESDEGEVKRIRFDLQTNRRAWKPLERSHELQHIKESKQFKSNKELAAWLHYPENLVSSSLSTQKKRDKYQKLMDEYELSEAYQVEFVRLYHKIRPMREFTVDEIIRNIFTRVKHQVIRSAKDFRKLGSVFMRAHANEEELYKYLKDPDMKIAPLYENTVRSGFVRDIENIMHQITTKKNQGVVYTSEEKELLDLLKETI